MLRVVHLFSVVQFSMSLFAAFRKAPALRRSSVSLPHPEPFVKGFLQKISTFFRPHSPLPSRRIRILSRFYPFVKRIFELSALFLQKNPRPAEISSVRRRYARVCTPQTRNPTLYNRRFRAATPRGAPDRRTPARRRRFSSKLCILHKFDMENSVYLNPCKPVAIPSGIRYNIKGIHATIKKGTRTIWQQSK